MVRLIRNGLVVALLLQSAISSASGRSGTSNPVTPPLSWRSAAAQSAAFEQNLGQVRDQQGNPRRDVLYRFNAPGLGVSVRHNSLSYDVTGYAPKQTFSAGEHNRPSALSARVHRVDVSFQGANTQSEVIVSGESADISRYTSDGLMQPKQYKDLTIKNIYPNIDLVYKTDVQGQLKYDIVVHPGGDLSLIRMKYQGQESIQMLGNKLSIATSVASMEESIPKSYISGDNTPVQVSYRLQGDVVGFSTAENISGKTLVIDPSLVWGKLRGWNISRCGQSRLCRCRRKYHFSRKHFFHFIHCYFRSV